MTDDAINLLRKKAESILAQKPAGKPGYHLEVSRLFHELQVYQLELEMQVEALREVSTELELQKRQFQHLFNAAPVGYLVVDKHGVIRDANIMAVHLLRQDKHLLKAKPLSAFIHSGDMDRFYLFLRYLKAAPHQQQCAVRLKNSSQEYIHVQLSAVSPEGGREDEMYITLTDISESQQVQQQLKDVNQRLAVALEASATGIWEVDTHNGAIILDENAQELLGLRAFDFKGTLSSLLEHIHVDDRQQFEEGLRKAIISYGAFNQTFRSLTETENVCYFQALGKRFGAHSRRFIGTLTDITEKVQMETAARLLTEQQQQAITAAAIEGEEREKKRVSEALHNGLGQLLYGMKLILATIKDTEPSVYGQINKLLTQAIDDTRNISHELAPSSLVTFGLKAALEEMTDRFFNQVSFDLKVINIPVKADQNLMLSIYRIVQELVNNSIQHGHANHIRILVNRSKECIKIVVADDGCGFKPESSGQTGNGLASIKNRLQIYNGTIKIDSIPHKETKTEILLKQFSI